MFYIEKRNLFFFFLVFRIDWFQLEFLLWKRKDSVRNNETLKDSSKFIYFIYWSNLNGIFSTTESSHSLKSSAHAWLWWENHLKRGKILAREFHRVNYTRSREHTFFLWCPVATTIYLSFGSARDRPRYLDFRLSCYARGSTITS